MVRVTSKVLASNCRVATLTLSVSCGCFCSIRLCGARGFSKLRSLMYWPWMVSGLGACCGWAAGPAGPAGGGVDMGRAGTMQGRAAQGAGGSRCRQLPSESRSAMIKRMNSTRLRPLIGVSACLKENGRGGWNHAVGDKYVQAAIRAVGGLPVVIPAFGREFEADGFDADGGMTEALDRLLDTMDGVLLTGSPSNVEPRHYEGEASRAGT